eukprot:2440778-Pyramimonas_sp.AAC.1
MYSVRVSSLKSLSFWGVTFGVTAVPALALTCTVDHRVPAPSVLHRGNSATPASLLPFCWPTFRQVCTAQLGTGAADRADLRPLALWLLTIEGPDSAFAHCMIALMFGVCVEARGGCTRAQIYTSTVSSDGTLYNQIS